MTSKRSNLMGFAVRPVGQKAISVESMENLQREFAVFYKNQTLLLTIVLAISTAVGCETFKPKKFENFSPFEMLEKGSEKDEPQTPAKMITIWHDATATNAEGKVIRGFAGRLYFFDRAQNPVKVDGEFIVYGFDDSSESKRSDQPDKKFTYPSEKLAEKHSISDVGHSYSVWIPWDLAGGERKNITLITMFKNADGKVVRGEATRNNLPGKKPAIVAEKEEFMKHFRQTVRNGVAPASHTEDVEAKSSKNQFDSTTIRLSPSIQERLGSVAGQTKLTRTSSSKPIVSNTENEHTSVEQLDHDPQAKPIGTTMRPKSRLKFQRIPVRPIGE